jgi:hypothetical protein
MLGVEGPEVEVLDAVLTVDVVECGALAESDTQDAFGVDAPARAAGEASRMIV